MAILRLWPATSGPAAVTSDTENYSMGTEFYVTAAATATAVYFWRPANAPATTLDVGIYQISAGGSTGTLLSSVTGVSVPANLGAWHRVELTTPVSLSASPTSYKVVVHSNTDNFYSATGAYWSTGPGASGIANGILNAPPPGQTEGSGQSTFVVGTALTYPNTGFNSSNYWVDVEVDDGQSAAPQVSAPFTAAAALSATAVPVLTRAAAFTAAAVLTASAVAVGGVPEVTADFTANATLTATVVPVMSVNAPFSATAALTASATHAGQLTIAEENALPGGVGKAFWLDGLDSEDLPAFPRSTYYTPGQTAQFSIDSGGVGFGVKVYRLGDYGDTGGLLKDEFAGTPADQPAPVVIPDSNGAVTCSAWSVNVEWAIPADATPGWYELVLESDDSTLWGHCLFCVSDANAKKPVLVVSSEATWHAAYNGFGGNNVYGATKGIGTADGRALCSSYDKPVITKDYVGQTHFFNGEYATLKYLESLGIEVGYATCEQINNDPTVMDGRDLVIFSGHNEYISQRIRDKTAAVIAAGTNVLNLAANDFFWRTTYAGTTFPTGNTSQSTGRVMWVKKDTMAGPTAIRSGGAGTPFTTEADWTGTWQDTRWALREPSTELLGDRFIANGIRADNLGVPFDFKDSPLWRDCAGIAALTSGQTFGFGAGTLGMEWDKPEGTLPRVDLSATTVDLENNSSDVNGENYNEDGIHTHAVSLVRATPTSGLIINFNTTQWGWALDDIHLRGTAVATPEAKQATLNALVDLGATPDTGRVTALGLVNPTPATPEDYGLIVPEVITAPFTATATLTATAIPVAVRTAAFTATATLTATASVPGVERDITISAGTLTTSWSASGLSAAWLVGVISANPMVAQALALGWAVGALNGNPTSAGALTPNPVTAGALSPSGWNAGALTL